MTKDEALKLALEALACSDDFLFDYHDCEPNNEQEQQRYDLARTQNKKAIEAIREALAKPEQEPHSWYSKQEDEWMTHKTRMEHEQLNSYTHKVGKFDLALYTAPPQRKPLTDEEIILIVADCASSHQHTDIHFARAIEAAHGIKGEA